MDLIVETDLGRDADDFFAICYLVSAGVNIRAITISPGDKDQISVAKFMCKQLGLGIPIGSAKPDREKSSVGGVHVHVLKKYGWPERMQPDGLGGDIIAQAFKDYPEVELFAIGPLQSVGQFLRANPDHAPFKATMQGGFVPYSLHNYEVKRLEKFEGLITCPTFNLGGDPKSAALFIEDKNITRSFVGKNVCHTIVYDKQTFIAHKNSHLGLMPDDMLWHKAQTLFKQTMNLFFDLGAPHKMFHDPTAAALMLHPEIGTWLTGTLYRENGHYGTKLEGNDKLLVTLNEEKLWDCIFSGS
jgi:inosine-uridine nucleoside N-ribohydrolase